MHPIRPEHVAEIVQIERNYRAQGIFAYAFVYCHTCQKWLYQHPLEPSAEFTSEQIRLAKQVSQETANSHMHAFKPPHTVQVWEIGTERTASTDGAHAPDFETLVRANSDAVRKMQDSAEKRFLQNWTSDIEQ